MKTSNHVVPRTRAQREECTPRSYERTEDPRGDLTINRVNTVMQLWYRFNFKNEYIPVYSNSDVFVTS